MSSFEKDNQDNDLWVFLSHSNKDYELVREVRNILEESRMRPLMFFLKCLDNDAEVWELVKREIDARSRFILCRSCNTEDPDGWVQKEFHYILNQGKPYEVVDLNDSMTLRDRVMRMVRRSNVYLMSSHEKRLSTFKSLLKKHLSLISRNVHDMDDIYDDHWSDIPGGASPCSWYHMETMYVSYYLKKGYIVQLITERMNDSEKSTLGNIIKDTQSKGFVYSFIIGKGASEGAYDELIAMHKENGVYIEDISDLDDEAKCVHIAACISSEDILKNPAL